MLRRYILGRLALRQPPIPEERYIEGYANFGNNVTLKINDTKVSTSRNASTGYFRLDLDSELQITSLKDFCSAETTGYGMGDGVITYINLSNIGDVSKCTTIENMFSNQKTVTAITLPKKMTMPLCTSGYRAFANCEGLLSLDASSIAFTNTNVSYINLSTYAYTLESCTTLKLGTFGRKSYFGSIAFNSPNVENLSFSGTIDCDMRSVTDYNGLRFEYMTKLTAESVANLVNALADRSDTTGRALYLSSEAYAKVTNQQKAIAMSKGWDILIK